MKNIVGWTDKEIPSYRVIFASVSTFLSSLFEEDKLSDGLSHVELIHKDAKILSQVPRLADNLLLAQKDIFSWKCEKWEGTLFDKRKSLVPGPSWQKTFWSLIMARACWTIPCPPTEQRRIIVNPKRKVQRERERELTLMGIMWINSLIQPKASVSIWVRQQLFHLDPRTRTTHAFLDSATVNRLNLCQKYAIDWSMIRESGLSANIRYLV